MTKATTVSELKHELEHAVATISEQELEIQHLKSEHYLLTELYAELCKTNAQIDKDNSVKEDEIAHLKSEVVDGEYSQDETLHAKNEHLVAENDRLLAKLGDQRSAINHLTKCVEMLNFTSGQ